MYNVLVPSFLFLGNRRDLNPCWNLLVKSLSRRAEQKKTVEQGEGSGDEKGNKKDKKDYTKRSSHSEIVGKFFFFARSNSWLKTSLKMILHLSLVAFSRSVANTHRLNRLT